MWIFYALGASLMWGLTYVLNEQVYKKISIFTSLAITTLVMTVVMFIVAYFAGFLKRDFVTISGSNRLIYLIIAGTVSLILAEVLIGLSIISKNATLSGLIEISYPIFIALFTYLIFRENQLNTGTLFGGLLVFLGVATIYLFNR
jgi:drug/metabolite transporter (DMT)-like permease